MGPLGEPSTVADLTAKATKLVTLPSGTCLEIRRLLQTDLLDLPQLWPIFSVAMQKLLSLKADRTEVEETRLIELNSMAEAMKDEAAADDELILRAVTRPKLSRDGAGDSAPLSAIGPIDRAVLIREITLLASGFDTFADLEEMARRAAQFRDEPVEPDRPEGVEADGDASEPTARVDESVASANS